MVLILAKLLLSPLVIALASWLAARSGARWGGFFIGLPTTALPFMVVVWLAHGDRAAIAAAAGSLCGQVTCTMFCIAYARTAPRLPSVAGMLGGLAVAVPIGLSTLLLGDSALVVGIAVAAAVVGLATWPQGPVAAALPTRRRDLVLRMALAGTTVFVTSSWAASLGAGLAGALASLPIILCVMCPSVHHAHGPVTSVALARGTLGSIPGTAALLCVVVMVGPRHGLGLAMVLGLVALLAVNAFVGQASGLLCSRLAGRRAALAR